MNLYIRLIFAALFCASLYSCFVKDSDLTQFSANTSPSGNWIAENFIVDCLAGECSTGLIAIHQSGKGDVFKFELDEPMPDLFFEWINDSHLRILTPDTPNARTLNFPRKLGDVFLTNDTYTIMSAADATARAKKVETYALAVNSVSATFSTAPYTPRKGRTCKLIIKAVDVDAFDYIGFELKANFGPASYAGWQAIWGDMDSIFSVGDSIDRSTNRMLTSADVVGAHGYGILPTGTGHKAIRGQFLDKNAIAVRDALNAAFFEIVYNFNFDARSVKFVLPTQAISSQILEFQKCTDNVDFAWSSHIKELKSLQHLKMLDQPTTNKPNNSLLQSNSLPR